MNKEIQYRIAADSYNSWLIIHNSSEISRHALSMMEGVEAFCPLDYKEEEEEFHINISSYLSLREYLSYPLSEKTLMKLGLQALDARIEAIKFLIPVEGIVYDLDLTYYEPERKTLHFVYLPNDERSTEKDFITWFKAVLTSPSVQGGTEEIKSILLSLEAEECNLLNLRQRLLLAIEKEPFQPSIPPEKKEGRILFIPKKQGIRDYSQAKPHVQAISTPSPPISRVKTARSSELKNLPVRKLKSAKDRNEVQEKEAEVKLKRVALVLSQIALVLLYLACLWFLKDRVHPFYKMALGLLIFVLLVDYVLVKNLLSQNYSRDKNQNILKDKAGTGLKERKNKKIQGLKPHSPRRHDKNEDSNSTLYLDDVSKRKYALINKENGEVTPLTSPNFKVGRQGYGADLGINDKSVGRLHAFIREEEDQCYIVDNSSINGTFINGIRLEPGEYSEILPGDELIFSRISFQFISLLE